jgi:hypothetical protein
VNRAGKTEATKFLRSFVAHFDGDMDDPQVVHMLDQFEASVEEKLSDHGCSETERLAFVMGMEEVATLAHEFIERWGLHDEVGVICYALGLHAWAVAKRVVPA